MFEYYPKWLSESESHKLYRAVLSNITLEQRTIKLYGKEVLMPSLSGWMAENEGMVYTYSGIKNIPQKFPQEVLNVKKEIEIVSEARYNSCFANFYRDGKDSVGFHSDNEKELGDEPVIASLSLGASRTFIIKYNETGEERGYILNHGDLLIMRDLSQKLTKHALLKSKIQCESRLNLTFRYIYL